MGTVYVVSRVVKNGTPLSNELLRQAAMPGAGGARGGAVTYAFRFVPLD